MMKRRYHILTTLFLIILLTQINGSLMAQTCWSYTIGLPLNEKTNAQNPSWNFNPPNQLTENSCGLFEYIIPSIIPEIHLDNNQSFDPIPCVGFGGYINQGTILPIELVYFQQYPYEDKAFQLKWKVVKSEGFSRFELEESGDGKNWQVKENIEYDDYSIPQRHIYESEVYNAPKQRLYFRLKLIDQDDHFEYSTIVVINNKNQETLSLFP